MFGVIGALLGTVGSFITGLFGFKGEQANTLQEALKVLGDVNAATAQRDQAVATVIAAEATSGHALAALWRPLLMLTFAGILISYWFGYAPPNIDGPLPPMMSEIFDLMKLGIGGYIGGRTIEKVMKDINVGQVLKAFLGKKIL